MPHIKKAEALSECGIGVLSALKTAAEFHLVQFNFYLPKLRNMSIVHPGKSRTLKGSVWICGKEGSYYLRNVVSFLECYQSYIANLDNPDIWLIKKTMLYLEYDRSYNSIGYTDDAYGGEVKVFVSIGKGKKFYELLHSGSKADLKTFLDLVERDIEEPMRRILNLVTERIDKLKDTEVDALFIAVENNDVNEVECLFNYKIYNDCSAKNREGLSPLLLAIKKGYPEIVRVILKEAGKSLADETDSEGNTPLHESVKHGNATITEMILKACHDIFDFVNVQNVEGMTALHFAAKSKSLESIMVLLENGACYSLKNKADDTPIALTQDFEARKLLNSVDRLFEQARAGDVESLEMLKDTTSVYHPAMLNARDDMRMTVSGVVMQKLAAYKRIARGIVDRM